MSHACLFVITDTRPDEAIIASLLQPYHEYECTGVEDQYVVDVDVTEEIEETYARHTLTAMRKLESGKIVEAYEDCFYRDPTPEEVVKLGRSPHGTGYSGEIGAIFTSKDWGDGRGYRTKIHYVPKGWEKTEVSISTFKTIEEFAGGWNGATRRADRRFYRRTNSNSKWDWWQVGGRYGGRLFPRTGSETSRLAAEGKILGLSPTELRSRSMFKENGPAVGSVEQCRWGDLDRGRMLAMRREAAGRNWDEEVSDGVHAFAILKDGVWYEEGKLGWFCVVSGADPDWKGRCDEILAQVRGDQWVTVIDYHI